ncbi:MAG: hypothetical protein WCJ87_02215 [Burkholderiales bacterium]
MKNPQRPAEQQADHQRHLGHRQRVQGERHNEADNRRARHDDRASGVELEQLRIVLPKRPGLDLPDDEAVQPHGFRERQQPRQPPDQDGGAEAGQQQQGSTDLK